MRHNLFGKELELPLRLIPRHKSLVKEPAKPLQFPAAADRTQKRAFHLVVAAIHPPFRITHVSLRNFWVPIQSLCKGGDYATLVPPYHPAQAATVPHTGLRSLGPGRRDV